MEMFQAKVVEKIKTHILCSVTFFLKIILLMKKHGKYGRAGQATDNNVMLACCMLDN
jgi:hypothetical protein